MGGFIFGYDTGQISNILLMPDFLLRFGACSSDATLSSASGDCSFTNVRAGLIVGLLSIGTLAGALMGAPIADWAGRRYAMVIECAVCILGFIIQISSTHVWQQFAVGRLVTGLGVGALSAAVPMYQAETAPAQIRGSLTATYQLFITFGIFIAYLISFGTRGFDGPSSWQTVVGIGIAWPVILSTGIMLMPESPRWLVFHDKPEKALHSIARVHGMTLTEARDHPLPNKALAEIQRSVEFERSYTGATGWMDCFRPSNKVLYRTILGMTLQAIQQLTGANYFFYYGSTIFESVGIQDSDVTEIILGTVNFVCTFGGIYIMEHYGRRLPLIIGGVWQGAWLIVFAAAGTAKNPDTDKGIGSLMIASACMFILGYAMTWAPGIWILIGETFPTRTRAKQASLSTASNWIWNFLLAFFTPFIVKAIDFRYGFVFAACNLAGAVIVYFFLYESSDLSLESVDLMYNDPTCKPWTSSRWAPPGYASRNDLAEQDRTKANLAMADEKKGTGSGTTSHDEGHLKVEA
ncbi:general substrate transporter [Gymnopus androsaceus JB14]|uniref:General substrate transporter n=1 Tax=Gymnopus androsaceus JB14 TaxID=1447944 RepID=A0A6A4HP38_9AGAR|nr:general substrate transporter [Gymnopus androsaceus JB14]